MVFFICIIVFLIDFLIIGTISRLITKNKSKPISKYNYTFRSKGSFIFSSNGRVQYSSGSLSKIGIRSNEVTLGLTILSFHKVFKVIDPPCVTRSIWGKCITLNSVSGESIKVYCDKEHVDNILRAFKK